MSTETPTQRWILWVAPLITLTAPALYIIGFLYEHGYLAHFGVESLMSLRSPQEYFVQAFSLVFILSLKSLPIALKYAAYAILSTFLVGIANYLINCQLERGADWMAQRWRSRINKKEVMASVNFAEKLFILLCAILFVLITIAFLGAVAYNSGQSEAERQQAAFKGCDIPAGKTEGCTVLMDGEKIIFTGMLLSHSATQIALFQNGKSTVMPIKEYTAVVYRE